MKIKSGLTFALCMAILTGGLGTAYADNDRGRDSRSNKYHYHEDSGYADRHNATRYSSGHHHDRGYHRGHGYKQAIVTLSPYRAARVQTIYYSPGFPRAIATYYRIGDYLPHHLRCEEPPRSVVVALPPVSRGARYVQVDQDVYLIAEASRQILDAVVLLSGVR